MNARLAQNSHSFCLMGLQVCNTSGKSTLLSAESGVEGGDPSLGELTELRPNTGVLRGPARDRLNAVRTQRVGAHSTEGP